MPETVSAALTAGDHRFVIVSARWNDFVTSRLVDGATEAILRHGGHPDRITRVYVPGSFELPLAAQKLARSGRYAAIVAVGCLIRGQTAHFDLLAAEVTKGLCAISLDTGVPVTHGVIAADSLEQAVDRCGGKHGNKGAEAALAAIEMANLLAMLGK